MMLLYSNYSLTDDRFYILDTKHLKLGKKRIKEIFNEDQFCKTVVFVFHDLVYYATFLNHEKIENEMK